MQTQTIMVMEPCSRCGQAIAPGEPAMQTASVDIDDYGRAVSSPVKSYHLSGRCYEDHRAAEKARREAPKAATRFEARLPTAASSRRVRQRRATRRITNRINGRS